MKISVYLAAEYKLFLPVQRNLSIDILRLVMAFFIVAQHGDMLSETSGPIFYLSQNGIFRLGVPVFLLISGYYFFHVTGSRRAWKWIKKLLILYVVWFMIYPGFWLNIYRGDTGALTEQFFCGYHHLWYLSHSAVAFALLWLLRDKPKILSVLFAVFTLCGIVLQYLIAGENHPFCIYRNAFFFCFPFIYIGYQINKHRIDERLTVRRLFALLSVGVALLLLESYLNYKSERGAFDILASLYIAAPALFIWAARQKTRSDNKTLALYSTGIYLSHVMILLVLPKILTLTPTLNVIAAFVLSLAASWILIRLNRKIPCFL